MEHIMYHLTKQVGILGEALLDHQDEMEAGEHAFSAEMLASRRLHILDAISRIRADLDNVERRYA